MSKVKVAILGATGFTGEKLVEILVSHPKVEIVYLSSRTKKTVPYEGIFPKFLKKTNLKCYPLNLKEAIKKADIFFLSLPHTVSMQFVPQLLNMNKKVIDLSADYRLKNTSLYKKFYGVSHKDKKNLKKAIYGLTEVFKKDITKAELIANPGCYATSILLALFPLLKANIINNLIYIDAKSAITGAGRKPLLEYHYSNISNNIWAYKPFTHQHVPEIVEIIKRKLSKTIKINFVPHVVGIEAGIYSTLYVSFKKKIDFKYLFGLYEKYYKDAPFVRIKKDIPRLKDVVGTNFCDIGFGLDKEGKFGVIISCLDNLIKGAAGSAVQNLNIMQGWKETEGLLSPSK
jgi:N-acetyl-gamma-glutamyl-phosphate reductase